MSTATSRPKRKKQVLKPLSTVAPLDVRSNTSNSPSIYSSDDDKNKKRNRQETIVSITPPNAVKKRKLNNNTSIPINSSTNNNTNGTNNNDSYDNKQLYHFNQIKKISDEKLKHKINVQ
eukprot:438469_1